MTDTMLHVMPSLAELATHEIRFPAGITLLDVYPSLERATREGRMDWSNPLTLWQIKYRFDPKRLVTEVLAADPDWWQVEVLDAAGEGKRQIAVRSGHGVGKTACVSWLLIWWICCFNPAKAVVTAPAAGTIQDGIGAEIKMWIERLPEVVQELLDVKTDRVELKSDRSGTFLTMRTSRPENPQTVAGIHAPHVLIAVDEASAMPDASFETVGSSMSAPHALMLLIGNPTLRGGYFYDCFHKMREDWHCIHVSSLNAKQVSPEYPKSIEKRYGKNSNTYRVRVEGEFPLGNDDSVIPGGAAEAALDRDVAPLMVRRLWGLDVARSLARDSSSLIKRQGNVIIPTDPKRVGEHSRHTPNTLRWQYDDTAPLIGAVKAEWDNTPESLRPEAILVDGIGFGATVADVLRSYELPAIAVNVSERFGANKSTYVNLKAELWFKMRDWFMSMTCSMIADGLLIEELTAPNYHHTPNGQIIIEDKDALRARVGFSPDGAEALMLTFAKEAAMAVPGQSRMGAAGQPLRRNVGGIV